MTSTRLIIVGAPKGKGRHRSAVVPSANGGKARVRTYTPKETEAAEARVREAWRNAGAIDLADGPISATLVAVIARPAAHLRVHGGLTAAGTRAWVPVRKPDLDNALKLVLDALNGHAYRDDAQVVQVTAHRRWALGGEREHSTLDLAQLEPTLDVAAAIRLLDEQRAARTSPIVRDGVTSDASDDLDRRAA